MGAPSASRCVRPDEHDLLSVARAIVDAAPLASVRSLLRQPVEAPRGWSPGALASLRRLLAVGATTSLLKRGGWRSEISLVDPTRRGPLWTRHRPPGWCFSQTTLDVLLVVRGATSTRAAPSVLREGDELFLYLACDLLERDGHDVTALGPWVAASRLARLAFPHAIGDRDDLPALAMPPTLLLEGLQPDLSRQLLRLEERFATMGSVAALTALGERHEADLGGLWDLSLEEGRPDLLTFVVDAAPRLLAAPCQRAVSLTPGRLEARQRALRASAATATVLEHLGHEHARWRRTGFLDEDYARCQAMLLRWERAGANAFEAAARRVQELSSLDALAT